MRNAQDQSIFPAHFSISRSVNPNVMAEGIESQGEFETLISLGFLFGQGFLIAGLPESSLSRKKLEAS